VVLLGDAAHAPHPDPGQGANQTFEDVHCLTAAIDKIIADIGADKVQSAEMNALLPAAVREYEEMRVHRATLVQRFCAKSGLIQRGNELVKGGQARLDEHLAELERFRDWLFRYPPDPTVAPPAVTEVEMIDE